MIAKETKSKPKTKRAKVEKEAEVAVVEEPTGKRPGRARKPSVTT